MKSPKNKKLLLIALIGGAILLVVVIASVVYLMGRDLSNEDSSAAIDDIENSGVSTDDSSWDQSYTCDYSLPDRRIYVCFPTYVIRGQKYTIEVHYMPNIGDPALPSWDIRIAGERIRSAKYSIKIPFESGKNTFKVIVQNTNFEGDLFEKTYTPIAKITKFDMPAVNLPSQVEANIDGARMSADLAPAITQLGLDPNNINLYWETKGFDNSICYSHGWVAIGNGIKMEGSVLGRKPGICKLTFVLTIITKSVDGVTYDKAYRATKSYSVRIVAPTATATPGHTLVPTPLPTVQVSSTPLPTPKISVTPIVYPTVSAISIYPSTSSIPANSEKNVFLSVNPPVSNVSGLQIRLKITGGTIVQGSYSSSYGLMALGTCANNSMTTTDQVCVDVVKTNGNFTPSEVGTFRILAGAQGTVKISTEVGNAYLVNESLVYSPIVNLAEYVITP